MTDENKRRVIIRCNIILRKEGNNISENLIN